MTGRELAQAVRKHRGKIQVRAVIGDSSAWLYVSKAELIAYLEGVGDTETGARLETTHDGDTVIDSIF
ncbi:hypothetical protein [Cupriavidus pauculus]|uniref:hypothetical protein n=1 Tax=Cupriavidus pauculus TaxID=82633 RepID=UPI001D0C0C2F|nr:hypothetical protein [Cupriavidus pauculus]